MATMISCAHIGPSAFRRTLMASRRRVPRLKYGLPLIRRRPTIAGGGIEFRIEHTQHCLNVLHVLLEPVHLLPVLKYLAGDVGVKPDQVVNGWCLGWI
jgi:hypothetical protein